MFFNEIRHIPIKLLNTKNFITYYAIDDLYYYYNDVSISKYQFYYLYHYIIFGTLINESNLNNYSSKKNDCNILWNPNLT